MRTCYCYAKLLALTLSLVLGVTLLYLARPRRD